MRLIFQLVVIYMGLNYVSADPENPNCRANISKLREEHGVFKLQKERETEELQNKILQLEKYIESLKTNLTNVSGKLEHSQQNLSLCANSVFVLSSRIELDAKWRDSILKSTQTNGNTIDNFIQHDFANLSQLQSGISDNIKIIKELIQQSHCKLQNRSNVDIGSTEADIPANSQVISDKNSPKDCSDILLSRNTESGVYNIYPDGNPVQVYCDMTTDGGGWTLVLQRGKRGDHVTDFYMNWTQYEDGFGDVVGGDYNIGLKNLHSLTSLHDQEFRLELSDWQGNSAYANYKTFWIEGTNEKYKLAVGNYSGNAGDSLEYHNGQYFSTFDQDNDSHYENCAVSYGGAWWYKACLYSNLNGKYFNFETIDSQGINWKH